MFRNRIGIQLGKSLKVVSPLSPFSNQSFATQSVFRRQLRVDRTFRARNLGLGTKKSIDVMTTKELISQAKSATALYQYALDMEGEEEYKPTRVRYAPSPTGEMHIGGLRTALFNYLFAKNNNGTFILRIEDTDKNREVEGADQRIVDVLKWAGLTWDEGVGATKNDLKEGGTGPFGPYYQSQRLQTYKKWVNTLVENKQAYYCFCTAERLKGLRKLQQRSKGGHTKYDRHCLGLTEEEVQQKIDAGEPYTIRMLVPEGTTSFNDMIHGQVTMNNRQLDDQILLKSDGFPTYHLANIVDDYLMGISHVIRGEEWLPSTPKHILLYNMLDIEPPVYAHIPLLVNNNGAKLSKRHGDISVDSFKEKGYLPQALINGLALLGWNPPSHDDPNILYSNLKVFEESEILTMEDLEAYFSLLKIGKSPCKFDIDKFKFFNSHHIRKSYIYYNSDERKESSVRFRNLLLKILPEELHSAIRQYTYKPMAKIMDMMIPRIQFYSDLKKHTYYFQKPDFDSEIAQKFYKKVMSQPEKSKVILEDLHSGLSELDSDFKREDVAKVCSVYLYEQNQKGNFLKNKEVFFLLRYVVTGNYVGAPIGDTCEVIGKQATLDRIQDMIVRLE
ncbi:unnamed protein product [Moneuplotes crassus]|uniref:glutamate--tRNA ligase n=1 Tax=Euplotes crassus TaxID=5936 RepID=A0AAD1X901_EUPCR|nr:unnamed protein product [Moneuplotes crassus]